MFEPGGLVGRPMRSLTCLPPRTLPSPQLVLPLHQQTFSPPVPGGRPKQRSPRGPKERCDLPQPSKPARGWRTTGGVPAPLTPQACSHSSAQTLHISHLRGPAVYFYLP